MLRDKFFMCSYWFSGDIGKYIEHIMYVYIYIDMVCFNFPMPEYMLTLLYDMPSWLLCIWLTSNLFSHFPVWPLFPKQMFTNKTTDSPSSKTTTYTEVPLPAEKRCARLIASISCSEPVRKNRTDWSSTPCWINPSFLTFEGFTSRPTLVVQFWTVSCKSLEKIGGDGWMGCRDVCKVLNA